MLTSCRAISLYLGRSPVLLELPLQSVPEISMYPATPFRHYYSRCSGRLARE